VATLESVSKDILNGLNTISSQIGRAVASDLHTLTLVRIFDDVIASDGSKIGTYSPVTVSIKKSKGRFTGNDVNLTDTGKLKNSYLVKPKGKKDYVLGFANVSRADGKTNTQLVNELEGEKYNKNIFALTSNEAREINNIIGDFLDRNFFK
jgi:hypothetical protein